MGGFPKYDFSGSDGLGEMHIRRVEDDRYEVQVGPVLNGAEKGDVMFLEYDSNKGFRKLYVNIGAGDILNEIKLSLEDLE